jgi:hypothetical protein
VNQQINHMNAAEGYLNAAEDYLAETSKGDLAAGVLKQAAQDLRRFHGATSAVERELYLDAYRWLTSDDCSWPFSFLNVCQLLTLAPEAAREELLGDMSLGLLSYWTRRCGRAARKFQVFLKHAFTNERNTSAIEPAPFVQPVH